MDVHVFRQKYVFTQSFDQWRTTSTGAWPKGRRNHAGGVANVDCRRKVVIEERNDVFQTKCAPLLNPFPFPEQKVTYERKRLDGMIFSVLYYNIDMPVSQ